MSKLDNASQENILKILMEHCLAKRDLVERYGF